jgi:hypothetical protein
MGGRPDQELLMVKRKGQAYQLLRCAISNADSEPDHALVGMVMATTSDEKNTQTHLRGLEDLILSKGGNEAFGTAFKLMHPDIFIMTYSFAPCTVPTLRELETSKSGLVTNLTAMNARARWLEAERGQRREPGLHGEIVQGYFDALDALLQCDCMGPLLCSDYNAALPYVRRARHFAMLFNLHKVLLCFGGDGFEQQTLFLQKLRQFCRESSARDAKTGAWLLKPGALVSLICHARKYVSIHFGSERDAFKTGVSTSRATIEGLKVFGYLSEASQEFVVKSLRSWTMDFVTPVEGWEFRASVIEGLGPEIVDLWVRQQAPMELGELAFRG